MSEIMQLGGGFNSSKSFSTCSFRVLLFAALKKSKPVPSEGNMSRFSHPSGNPASWYGNWTSSNRIWELEKVDVKRDAFWWVVTTVTVTPFCARIFAMSIMGIMWPWDIRGNRTKLRLRVWELMLLEMGLLLWMNSAFISEWMVRCNCSLNK